MVQTYPSRPVAKIHRVGTDQRKRELMSWANVDELKAYPWYDVDCPACEEPELARDITRPFTGFVCMACGCRAVIEQP